MPTDHRISKTDAEDEIKRYIGTTAQAITTEYENNLPEDLRYYLRKKIVSFVFRKDQLDAMFSGNANALRLYLAAKPGIAPDPSMVAVPCYISDDESTAQNRLPSPPNDGGIQYPITFEAKSPFDLATD